MNNTSPDIVCTLTQPELRLRKVHIRKTLTPHLLASCYAEGVSRLAFARPAVSRVQLEHLIKLEQACCPFLTFEIREMSKEFTLIVSGPEGSEDLVRDLFSSEPSAPCGCSGRPSQADHI
ncbi:MAG: hypothetical protein AAGL24_21165 [Pseudomonadota bacterium]